MRRQVFGRGGVFTAPGVGVDRSRCSDVERHLAEQLFDGVELEHIAQPAVEIDFERSIVEIAVEIEEVDFDFDEPVAEGRIRSEANCGGARAAVVESMSGVDSRRRKEHFNLIDVGRRKTELGAATGSVNDHASDAIGATERLSGEVESAFANQLTNSRTGDDLSGDFDGRGDFKTDFVLLAKFTEKLDVSGAVSAEKEVGPFDHRADLQFIAEHVVEEFSRLGVEELTIDGIDDGGVEAERLENLKFSFGPNQGRWSGVGTKKDGGMGIESKSDRRAFYFGGQGERPFNESSMTAVDAVEVSDGDGAAAKRIRDVVQVAISLHFLYQLQSEIRV